MAEHDLNHRLAAELGVREAQVSAAVGLLDGGATVPFIARYRKEATGTLDDAQLRTLQERLGYLRELEERRSAILESIRSQGKLEESLEAQILAADTKARLEDIYLPYKPKRRTRAQLARAAGLEPLAGQLLADPSADPVAGAAAYADPARGVADAAAALDGAQAILVERFAEDADLLGSLRERMWQRGQVRASVRDGQQQAGAKYADYFDFRRALRHAAVAPDPRRVPRREKGVLDLTMDPADTEPALPARTAGPGSPSTRPWSPAGPEWPRQPAQAVPGQDGGSSPIPCGSPGGPGSACTSARTCACGYRSRPRTRPSGCSRPTCVTCCWPPRPGPARPWAWIPACAPA